jgi:hypothetical protein
VRVDFFTLYLRSEISLSISLLVGRGLRMRTQIHVQCVKEETQTELSAEKVQEIKE